MKSDCLEGRQQDLLATVLCVVCSFWKVNGTVSQQKGNVGESRIIVCFHWGGWVDDGINNQN